MVRDRVCVAPQMSQQFDGDVCREFMAEDDERTSVRTRSVPTVTLKIQH